MSLRLYSSFIPSVPDLLAHVGDVYCIFVTFPCGVIGQVWYLIVSFPDLCHLSYFESVPYHTTYSFIAPFVGIPMFKDKYIANVC